MEADKEGSDRNRIHSKNRAKVCVLKEIQGCVYGVYRNRREYTGNTT
jgi:hypothetical protein